MSATPARNPLPSWNEGPVKAALLDFVARVTAEGEPGFVPRNERVAAFDNDGTLWCEMPVPVQAFFIAARIQALAPQHPKWQTTEPFKSLLAGDVKGVMAQGLKGIAEKVKFEFGDGTDLSPQEKLEQKLRMD